MLATMAPPVSGGTATHEAADMVQTDGVVAARTQRHAMADDHVTRDVTESGRAAADEAALFVDARGAVTTWEAEAGICVAGDGGRRRGEGC